MSASVNAPLSNSLANAFPANQYFDIDELAVELGVKTQRARQILAAALKKRAIQNLVKKEGLKKLYAEPMVEQLRALYNAGTFGKTRSRIKVTSMEKTALLIVKVPVFDPGMKKMLLQKFKDEANLAKFLQDQLLEAYKPVAQQLKALEEEFETKKKALFGEV